MHLTPPTPRRIVAATTWARPSMVAAYLLAVAGTLPEGVEFVIAVPGDPDDADAAAARAIVEGIPDAAARVSLSVESFSEALGKPFHVAFIPPADQREAWDAFVIAVTEARHICTLPVKDGATLHAGLQDFDEAGPAATAGSSSPVGGNDRWSAYLGEGITLVRLGWGGRVAVPTSHVLLVGQLIEDGQFEPSLTAYLRRTVRPGDLVVDVGANIGLHTVLFGMLTGGTGRVIAYEPFGDNETCLRKSVAASGLIGVVDVRPRAASDSAGTASMAVSQVWRGQGTLVRDAVEVLPGLVDQDSYSIEIDTVRLDEDLAHLDHIDLVKIDVEGAENRVFAGMEGLLDRNVVRRIAFECYRTHLGGEWPAFAERLTTMERQGWTFSILDEQGTDYEVPVTTIIEHGFFETVVATSPVG